MMQKLVPSLLKYEDYKGNQKNGVPTYKNKKRKSVYKLIKRSKKWKRMSKEYLYPYRHIFIFRNRQEKLERKKYHE